jgi:hypothetical protein
MKSHQIISRKVSTSFAVGAACALSLAACGGGGASGSSGSQMAQQMMGGFTNTALVS